VIQRCLAGQVGQCEQVVLGRAIDVWPSMRHGFSGRPPLRDAAGKMSEEQTLMFESRRITCWRIMHRVNRKDRKHNVDIRNALSIDKVDCITEANAFWSGVPQE